MAKAIEDSLKLIRNATEYDSLDGVAAKEGVGGFVRELMMNISND